jgi:hypothetical protein
MAGEQGNLKPTQLREYYDALAALKEQEQTALAELHAEDPQRLAGRFEHSVKTVAQYPAITEPFYGARSEAWKKEGAETIDSTAAFTALLAEGEVHDAAGAPELSFRYIDREVFPLRSREIVSGRSARRSIDLLLESRDGFPIVGELKIKADKPTYYALVQALMYAVELSSESQRNRLAQHCSFKSRGGGELIDVYILGYQAPDRGAYRARSFEASKMIAAKLMKDPRVSSVVRRIAYLEASQDAERRLVFKPLFMFAAGG